MLYIVGTPIGNLDDMTFRGVETLKNADLIAAEDTRQTIKLLSHFGIETPLTSYHEHNRAAKGVKLMEMLKEGKNVALVSDAGMPCISDPGCELVKECIAQNVEMTVVPGPTAFVTGVVLSGLKTQNFKFIGFLSVRTSERTAKLNEIKNETETLIFYEAPHKLLRTLNDLLISFGDRNIAVCRELTKKYEEVRRGTISEVKVYFENNPIKGEFVLVVEGAPIAEKTFEMSVGEHLISLINQGIDKKQAIAVVAKERNLPKREVYDVAKDLPVKIKE